MERADLQTQELTPNQWRLEQARLQDTEGVTHTARVQAESLYEAVALVTNEIASLLATVCPLLCLVLRDISI